MQVVQRRRMESVLTSRLNMAAAVDAPMTSPEDFEDEDRTIPCPGGTPDNSPALQLESPKAISSPEGTAESALPTKVSRPFGTYCPSFVDTQS
jgi:hypothetical protein